MIANLLQHYNLTAFTATPLHGGHVFSVESAEGSFVFKQVPKNEERHERLMHEHRLLRHLHESGVPVACPVTARDGRSCVEDADAFYVLMPKIKIGFVDMFGPDAGAAYAEIGRAFGRFHRAMASFPDPKPNYTLDPLRQLHADIEPALRKNTACGKCHELATMLDETRGEMCEALTDLPSQLIHGDLHGGNVCLADNRVTGFIDCNHLPHGPRLYDLCYFINDFAKKFVGDAALERAFLAHYPRLLAGYDSVQPLTPRERRAFWPMLLASQIAFCHYKLTHNVPGLQTDFAVLRWVYHCRALLT